jgi:hypothetical protein
MMTTVTDSWTSCDAVMFHDNGGHFTAATAPDHASMVRVRACTIQAGVTAQEIAYVS